MRVASLLLALLLTPALAGCIDGLDAARTDPAPALTLLGHDATEADGALRWTGGPLQGSGVPREGNAAAYACWLAATCASPAATACTAASCERVAFRVPPPAEPSRIVVSLRWPTDPTLDLALSVEDASGAPLGASPPGFPGAKGAAVVLDAKPGDYVAVVQALAGRGAYEAAIRLEPLGAGGARDLLPNLVTLPPTDLTLETPDYAGASFFVTNVPGLREATEAAGVKGCRADEWTEGGARRCLRFSTAVGNLGDGPLEVRLPPTSTGAGEFMQRVWRTDGSFEDLAAGRAEWHAVHAHWHNAANDLFTLHAWDEATGAPGAEVATARKLGICFADLGVIDVGLPWTRETRFDGRGCLVPDAESVSTMGLTEGWYDLYSRLVSDQYIDVTGVADGIYVLCTATNPDGLLLEADPTDNAACTRFRMTGDLIETLDPAPYHAAR